MPVISVVCPLFVKNCTTVMTYYHATVIMTMHACLPMHLNFILIDVDQFWGVPQAAIGYLLYVGEILG